MYTTKFTHLWNFSMTYTTAVCTVKNRGIVRSMQSLIPIEILKKLVHLVGFIIGIYHDARSPKRQIM